MSKPNNSIDDTIRNNIFPDSNTKKSTIQILNYKDYVSFFNLELDKMIKNQFPENIHDMIKFMSSGGKRLRGVLALLFGGINIKSYYNDNECDNNLVQIAIIIELLHCLSLIIDDSPSMDNDDTRRDKESFHKKYGLEKTNFFCYYLINKLLLQINKLISNIKNQDIFINLIKTNLHYLVDGQCIDININNSHSGNNNSSANTITDTDTNQNNTNNTVDIYNDEFIKKNTNKLLKSNSESNIDPRNTNSFQIVNEFNQNTKITEEFKILLNLISIDFPKFKLESLSKNVELTMKKTSSLFYLSIIIPTLYRHQYYNINNTHRFIEKIGHWANIFGIVFQYSDDMLDIEQDLAKEKPNITNILNPKVVDQLVNNSIRMLSREYEEIYEAINQKYEDNTLVYPEVTPQILNQILKIINNRYKV